MKNISNEIQLFECQAIARLRWYKTTILKLKFHQTTLWRGILSETIKRYLWRIFKLFSFWLEVERWIKDREDCSKRFFCVNLSWNFSMMQNDDIQVKNGQNDDKIKYEVKFIFYTVVPVLPRWKYSIKGKKIKMMINTKMEKKSIVIGDYEKVFSFNFVVLIRKSAKFRFSFRWISFGTSCAPFKVHSRNKQFALKKLERSKSCFTCNFMINTFDDQGALFKAQKVTEKEIVLNCNTIDANLEKRKQIWFFIYQN